VKVYVMSAEAQKTFSEVNEIYNLYHSAALNKTYYGALLARYQKWNTFLEIVIALTATGSGVSGWAYWQSGALVNIWGGITLISALLAVMKPFLQLNKKVEHYSRLFTGHLDNYLSLGAIVTKLRRRQELTSEMLQQFEIAEQRFIELSREDDPRPIASILQKCDEQVRKELPDENFWYPKRSSRTRRATKSEKKPDNVADFPAAPRTS
jgi:hypothetical protein